MTCFKINDQAQELNEQKEKLILFKTYWHLDGHTNLNMYLNHTLINFVFKNVKNARRNERRQRKFLWYVLVVTFKYIVELTVVPSRFVACIL